MIIGKLVLKNNVCLAPMAGVTDLPFRTLARRFGCGWCFTEMVSANGLMQNARKSRRYLVSTDADRPLGVQIFGADPGILAQAGRSVTSEEVDSIDINMGCPVKKVVKAGAGAALMRDPLRVSRIVESVRKATDLPLTVKIRAGWKRFGINAVEIAVIAEECGADGVIIHPRTVEQGFSGDADWDLIARVKQHLAVPVIGSGDIRRPEDAGKMLVQTGCDGVMIGRGALGNPWIFDRVIAHLKGNVTSPPPTLADREAIIGEHLTMSVSHYGADVGLKAFRKHLLWYTKGLRGGAQFRQQMAEFRGERDMLAAVHRYFSALEMRENGAERTDDKMMESHE
jgi:nifR3 family TIM-barrel protein